MARGYAAGLAKLQRAKMKGYGRSQCHKKVVNGRKIRLETKSD